ncbi:MAG: RidA family protein [Alphaproteobacteria bacterium]|nr:RidA family protein [Alphaproteobacteria bacterium]
MFEPVETGIFQSPGPYTGTAKAGTVVYTVQIPKDPETGAFVGGDVRVQTRRMLANLKLAIEAAGGTLADVARVTLYLVDLADKDGMNEVYRAFFAEPFPVRAILVVKALTIPGMRVEIEATAHIGR